MSAAPPQSEDAYLVETHSFESFQVTLPSEYMKHGLVRPRLVLIRYEGTHAGLMQELERLKGVSIEYIEKLPSDETSDKPNAYLYYILLQQHGYIALPRDVRCVSRAVCNCM